MLPGKFRNGTFSADRVLHISEALQVAAPYAVIIAPYRAIISGKTQSRIYFVPAESGHNTDRPYHAIPDIQAAWIAIEMNVHLFIPLI